MGEYADIKGTTHSSFKVGASATAGHVLTADAAGVGTWQEPTGEGTTTMTLSKSFMITNPTADADGPVWRAPESVTITAIHVLCIGGTSLTGQLWEYDSNGANGAVVDSSDIVATAGTNVNDDGTLSNPGIASGNYVGWKTTSVSGVPTYLIVTFDYTASKQSKSFAITNPTAVATPVWRAPNDCTITAVHGICFGGTNVVGSLWEFNGNGASGSAINTANMTITTSNTDDTTLVNANIASGNYVGFSVTSVSGAVSQVLISFEYA
jgi:hypothetical protein